MSCQPATSIPAPPTSLSSCAVPIGGSNSSILDACCNGHINAIATYSAPSSSSSSSEPIVNTEDDDGCFQYCITDSPAIVQSCLAEKMGGAGEELFGCFNVDKAVGARKNTGGYESMGVRSGSASWALKILIGLGVVGAVVGGM